MDTIPLDTPWILCHKTDHAWILVHTIYLMNAATLGGIMNIAQYTPWILYIPKDIPWILYLRTHGGYYTQGHTTDSLP